MNADELKSKKSITRSDIEELFSSIGKPGENREEKLTAMQSLGKNNFQGHPIELTIESYQSY